MRRLVSCVLMLMLFVLGCRTQQVSLWGEVPLQCACHDEPVARIASNLQDAQLVVDFKLEEVTEAARVFSLTFDPSRVSSERVQQIVESAGGRIIPSPVAR
jgi:hypothetical protein